MSKNTSQKRSDGHIQKKPQSIAQTSSRKTPKKPMKSNIASKMRIRQTENVTPGEVEGEDDEGDSSATEEYEDTAEDPDVPALPGAQRHPGGETGKRLAGHDRKQLDMPEDIVVADDTQIVAGADDEQYEGSDENDYEDVENVSVSDEESADEDEDRSILRSAEQDLINEFERQEQRQQATVMTNDMTLMALDEDKALARRLSLQVPDSQIDDFGFPINMDEDPFHGLPKDDENYRNLWSEAETALWRMPEVTESRESSDPASANQKRVRFQEIEIDSSSGSESEDPNEVYPDLLDAAVVPNLDQLIAFGLDYDARHDQNGNNDNESFYDFEDEDERLAFQVDEESDSDEDLSSSDSDEGDTTDDESRDEQIARMQERKKAIGEASSKGEVKERPAKAALHNAARTPSTPSTSRPTTPKSSKVLKFGTFALDPTRATMTTDSDGKKIKLLPPATPLDKDKAFWRRAKTANSSRDGSPGNSFLTISTPRVDSVPDRPFTTESTLGSMFGGNLDVLRNNEVTLMEEGVFPSVTVNPETSFISTTTMDDSDTDLQDVNMNDFLDLDDSDSDTEGLPTEALTSPAEPDMFDTFMDISTPSRGGSALMEHFDQYRGVVGSFRSNQYQVKQVSSLPSHPAKRASAHEYNALQKGRRGAANTPITPARKKRVSQDLTSVNAGVRKSISSPFTARRPRSRGNSLAGMTAVDLLTLGRDIFETV